MVAELLDYFVPEEKEKRIKRVFKAPDLEQLNIKPYTQLGIYFRGIKHFKNGETDLHFHIHICSFELDHAGRYL